MCVFCLLLIQWAPSVLFALKSAGHLIYLYMFAHVMYIILYIVHEWTARKLGHC